MTSLFSFVQARLNVSTTVCGRVFAHLSFKWRPVNTPWSTASASKNIDCHSCVREVLLLRGCVLSPVT